MKKVIVLILFLLILATVSNAGFLDNMLKNFTSPTEKSLDNDTMISGLKEALSLGTDKAVTNVSAMDGYLGNELIKILIPENIQKVANVLSKIGYEEYVNSFVTSMNRAAEKAAPKAKEHFVTAIKDMTFEDAKNILNGGDTAATDYFKSKTYDGLYADFKPEISKSMDDVGATRSYKDMMGKYTSLPFMKAESLDLDNYVTNEALDGLFYMIAQEEKKIRTDPAARVTELLQKVFGK